MVPTSKHSRGSFSPLMCAEMTSISPVPSFRYWMEPKIDSLLPCCQPVQMPRCSCFASSSGGVDGVAVGATAESMRCARRKTATASSPFSLTCTVKSTGDPSFRPDRSHWSRVSQQATFFFSQVSEPIFGSDFDQPSQVPRW